MSAANKPNKPVALIIGASRGIGRQVAIDLATKHGYYGTQVQYTHTQIQTEQRELIIINNKNSRHCGKINQRRLQQHVLPPGFQLAPVHHPHRRARDQTGRRRRHRRPRRRPQSRQRAERHPTDCPCESTPSPPPPPPKKKRTPIFFPLLCLHMTKEIQPPRRPHL